MALPELKNEVKYIKVQLPSGKSIGIRGWKFGDEKELIFTLDSEEDIDEKKVDHIVAFLRRCVDNQNLFDTLSETDIKKVALEIRRLSKGDGVEYSYRCTTEGCGMPLQDEVKLSKAEVIKKFDTTPIAINESLAIVLKDVSYKDSIKLYERFKDSLVKYTFYYMVNSIEAVTKDGEPYTEFTEDEMVTWLENLDSNDMANIQKEFETRLSSLKLEHKINCPKCKVKQDVHFGELLSFLIL